MAACQVKLVALSRGAGELEGLGPEDIIVHAARVSNPENQTNYESGPKLLRYCIKNRHWSIFETASMTVEITTSRAIAEQILRHRSATFQQFSTRYAKADANVVYEARSQDLKNRQSSVDDLPPDVRAWFTNEQDRLWKAAYGAYTQALEKGIAKECARFFLPMSVQSRLYMTMNVRDWIHYVNLRSGNGTQKEHQDIALRVQQIMKEQIPTVCQALDW